MTNVSSDFNSSRLGQIMLAGTEEIIGQTGMQTLFRLAQYSGPSQTPALSDMGSIQLVLEEAFGPRGGRGVSLLAGRSSFRYILRQYGESLGLTRLAYRLLPGPSRLKSGLATLAGWFSDLSQGSVSVEVIPNAWLWRMERCPLCLGRHSTEPVCTYIVGLIQEFMAWAAGGKIYQVQEVDCLAMGSLACIVRIDGRPLD
ncbi:MAG TPA: V4R domain-containing protein [Anaerolineaceae bacterium]|nr:V4R domain-containing protein [Anaerolineaceae bacterium]